MKAPTDEGHPSYEGDVLDWVEQQKVIAKIRELTCCRPRRAGGLNIGGFDNAVGELLDSAVGRWHERLFVKKDAAFENAERKIREAKVAFDKLSDKQREGIYSLMLRYCLDHGGLTVPAKIAMPKPEVAISDIIVAFSILTRKSPHPEAHGKGDKKNYAFRYLVRELRVIVEESGGKLYLDPKQPDGGRKFRAVVDALRSYVPSLVPDKLPLKSIDEDWRAYRKANPPNKN